MLTIHLLFLASGAAAPMGVPPTVASPAVVDVPSPFETELGSASARVSAATGALPDSAVPQPQGSSAKHRMAARSVLLQRGIPLAMG